jgi:hypothetical protein
MSWALIDDQFYDHPKVLALLEHEDGLAAAGLWALALGWAKRHADPHAPGEAGHLPASLPRRMGGSTELAKLLVAVGLWQATETGWIIHDFAHWQQLDAWATRSAKAANAARTRWDRETEKIPNDAPSIPNDAPSIENDTWSNAKAMPTSPHLTSPNHTSKEPESGEQSLRDRSSDSSLRHDAGASSCNGDGKIHSPRTTDRKAVWVTWAIAQHGVGAHAAAAMTKDQLQELAETPDRPGLRGDVDRLCEHLASRIEEQTGRRPKIGKEWRQPARFLIDIDGHTEEQIHKAIDWCQDDEFWRSNILSMRKLRAKYVTLRAAATRPARRVPAQAAPERWD